MVNPPPCTFERIDFTPYNLDRQVLSKIILASLGSVLVHSFSVTMVSYSSVELLMRSNTRIYYPVSQSYFFISVKLLKVDFGPGNRALYT